MLEIVSQIEIPAPPSQIWSLVTDFESYPTWQKAIAFQGKAGEGEAIVYLTSGQLRFAKSKMLGMPGTITNIVPGQRLVWEIGLPIIYAVNFAIMVEPSGGGTRVTFSTSAKGLLPAIAPQRVVRIHKPIMEAYTIALKARAARVSTKLQPNRKARRRAR